MDVKLVAGSLIVICEDYTDVLDFNVAVQSKAGHLIDLMTRLIADDYKNLDQANRWVGFVQGCLLSAGAATLEEMKELNKNA